MTTRSEWFRYVQERSHPAPDVAARPAERTARRRAGRAGAAVYALEPGSVRPSRKSTRKSANRQKTDVQFRMKRREGEVRPRPAQ